MDEFSNFSLNLDFKLEQEQNNTLNFLTTIVNRAMQNQNGSLDAIYTENPQLHTVLFLMFHVIQ